LSNRYLTGRVDSLWKKAKRRQPIEYEPAERAILTGDSEHDAAEEQRIVAAQERGAFCVVRVIVRPSEAPPPPLTPRKPESVAVSPEPELPRPEPETPAPTFDFSGWTLEELNRRGREAISHRERLALEDALNVKTREARQHQSIGVSFDCLSERKH
jgi:hypothetical protein